MGPVLWERGRCVLEEKGMNVCEQCGREYVPTKSYQRFCDNECRKDWHLRRYHLRRGRPGTLADEMMVEEVPADFQRRF
jgi:hypothetical protein